MAEVSTDLRVWRGQKAGVLFSGGKDSLFALAKALEAGLEVQTLVYAVTTAPLPHNQFLKALPLLADALGTPLTIIPLEKGREQSSLIKGLRRLKVSVLVAGNLWLQDIHDWYAQACEKAGMALVEPLWHRDTRQLLRDEMTWGMKALIIGADERFLPPDWVGTVLSLETLDNFLAESDRQGFDPCGEKGEFHTFVLFSPLHRFPLQVTVIRKEVHDLRPYGGRTYFLISEVFPSSGEGTEFFPSREGIPDQMNGEKALSPSAPFSSNGGGEGRKLNRQKG